MDLEEIRQELMSEDFDVEKHASKVIQSGKDISKYTQQLAEAELQVDALLQEQVRE